MIKLSQKLLLSTYPSWFQRLPPARGGTAQKKIIHLANWSQLIHPGPASSLTKVILVSSKSCVNADSLLIRAAATSTSGTLNDLTTDLIMANNNNLPLLRVAVEGSDNPVSLEKPCQASLPPDQQGRHSLGRQPEVQYVA